MTDNEDNGVYNEPLQHFQSPVLLNHQISLPVKKMKVSDKNQEPDLSFN